MEKKESGWCEACEVVTCTSTVVSSQSTLENQKKVKFTPDKVAKESISISVSICFIVHVMNNIWGANYKGKRNFTCTKGLLSNCYILSSHLKLNRVASISLVSSSTRLQLYKQFWLRGK